MIYIRHNFRFFKNVVLVETGTVDRCMWLVMLGANALAKEAGGCPDKLAHFASG